MCACPLIVLSLSLSLSLFLSFSLCYLTRKSTRKHTLATMAGTMRATRLANSGKASTRLEAARAADEAWVINQAMSICNCWWAVLRNQQLACKHAHTHTRTHAPVRSWMRQTAAHAWSETKPRGSNSKQGQQKCVCVCVCVCVRVKKISP